jgi:hypothetical protein
MNAIKIEETTLASSQEYATSALKLMDLLKVKRLKLRIHAREFTVFNSLAIDGKAFVDSNHDDGRNSDSLFCGAPAHDAGERKVVRS